MIRTDDLFLAAFALSRGGELIDIEVSGINGRRLAFFRIEGAGLVDVEREYYGPVVVNLLLLKAAVRRLKDAAFDAIREEERRTSYASCEDQPRTDRFHQVPGPSRRARR